MGLQLRPALAPALDSSASNMASTSTSEQWEQVAKQLWLTKFHTSNAKPEIIKSRIWDPLEAETFDARSLALLESLQILEGYVTDRVHLQRGPANGGKGISGLHSPRMLRTSSSSSLPPLWLSSSEHMFRYGVGERSASRYCN
jgi:Intron-binding protein aquarius N-terminus